MRDYKVEGGLLPSDFEYKLSLEAFFTGKEFREYHGINRDIYRFLEDIKRYNSVEGGFWRYLNFFNFLYEQLDIIKKHPNQPLRIIEHLKSLDIDDSQLYLFLKSLNQFRGFTLFPITLDMLDNLDIKLRRVDVDRVNRPRKSWLWTCIAIIQGEFGYMDKLSSRWPTKFMFDFEDVEQFLEASKGPEETIANLVEWISCYEQQVARHPNMFVNDGGKFIKLCERKIERIKRLQAEGLNGGTTVQSQLETTFSASSPSEDNIKQESCLLQYCYSKEQVLNYFMQLSRYYSEEQVTHFLKANFQGFAEPRENIERVKLPVHKDLDKQHIMYMVYRFWILQKKRMFNKRKAAALLEDSFVCFESFDVTSNESIERRTVYSNMGKEPKKRYPFSDAILG